jgi:hypothetical protein
MRSLLWAEPDLDHAAEQMRRVFSDTFLADSIGQAAARDIRTNFSAKKIGELIRERLHCIKRSHLIPY